MIKKRTAQTAHKRIARFYGNGRSKFIQRQCENVHAELIFYFIIVIIIIVVVVIVVVIYGDLSCHVIFYFFCAINSRFQSFFLEFLVNLLIEKLIDK